MLKNSISFQAGLLKFGRVMQSSFFFTKKLISSLLGNVVNFNIVGLPKILHLVKLKEYSKTEAPTREKTNVNGIKQANNRYSIKHQVR